MILHILLWDGMGIPHWGSWCYGFCWLAGLVSGCLIVNALKIGLKLSQVCHVTLASSDWKNCIAHKQTCIRQSTKRQIDGTGKDMKVLKTSVVNNKTDANLKSYMDK